MIQVLLLFLGIKGVVQDTQGNPIPNAEVKVVGRDHPVFTTSQGEYWRLLMPGKTYTIQVRARILYSMVDEFPDELESGQTRKKILKCQLFFYFLLRHALKLPSKQVLYW